MGKMRLFGEPGWGSAIVEAQLDWYGLPYDFDRVGNLFKDAEGRQRLEAANPLAQIPTLVLADGAVLTESAAITLYLAEVTGTDSLVPASGDAARATFLRWLVYLVANVYPTYTYGDEPARFVDGADAQQSFRSHVDAYAKRLYSVLEGVAGA
ncbi:MAG: glutathione S-transferase, partial [Lysobacterales bacterium]